LVAQQSYFIGALVSFPTKQLDVLRLPSQANWNEGSQHFVR